MMENRRKRNHDTYILHYPSVMPCTASSQSSRPLQLPAHPSAYPSQPSLIVMHNDTQPRLRIHPHQASLQERRLVSSKDLSSHDRTPHVHNVADHHSSQPQSHLSNRRPEARRSERVTSSSNVRLPTPVSINAISDAMRVQLRLSDARRLSARQVIMHGVGFGSGCGYLNKPGPCAG